MKSKKGLIVLILAFALLIGVAAAMYDRLSAGMPADQISVENDPGEVENDDTQELTKAPDFTVYTKDGTPVKLSELVGKPIVLNLGQLVPALQGGDAGF